MFLYILFMFLSVAGAVAFFTLKRQHLLMSLLSCVNCLGLYSLVFIVLSTPFMLTRLDTWLFALECVELKECVLADC